MDEKPKDRVHASLLFGLLTMVLIIGLGVASALSESVADVLTLVFIGVIVFLFALIYFGDLFHLKVVSEYFVKGKPIREVLLPAIPGLLAIVVIFGGTQMWHNFLSPKARTTKRIDRLFTALDSIRTDGNKLPDEGDLAATLDVLGSDPHNLSSFYLSADNAFVDTWGREIVYKRGSLSQFSLRSFGPNGVEDSRFADDIVRGDLIVLDLNPTDEIIDGVKGLFKREDAPSDGG